MKKISILSFPAILIFLSPVHAQITKGSLLLGGNINLYTVHTSANDNSADNKQDAFAFSASLGKAIKDNLVFGGGLSYSYSKYEQSQGGLSSDQKSKGYGANVFLRKYKPIGKGFYIFLEGVLGGSFNKSDNIPLIFFKNERTSFKLDANPGISYAIAKKLQLEIGFNQLLGISYYHEKGLNVNNNDTPYKTNSFNITTGFNNSYFSSLYFGFRVLLGS